jgi:hypothetical protein
MGFFRQFDEFDPLNGSVLSYPIDLSRIANRARSLLKSRSLVQIQSAANTADWMIENYIRDVKQPEEILRLRSIVEQGWQCKHEDNFISDDSEYHDAERFFHFEDHGRGEGAFDFIEDMEYELITQITDKTNEVEALKECIGWYDLNDDAAFPNGQSYEYFAVLSLWLIGDTLRWLNWRPDPESIANDLQTFFSAPYPPSAIPGLSELMNQMNREALQKIPALIENYQRGMQAARSFSGSDATIGLSLASASALCAMDAVCYAEHLSAVEQIKTVHASELARTTAEAKRAEREQRSINAQRLNILRHETRNKARAEALTDWEKDRFRFPSAEKAGSYYADWLEKQGYTYEPRTVRDWILGHAKRIGVKFR